MFFAIYFVLLAIVITLICLNKFVFKENYDKRRVVLDKISKIICVVWMALSFLNLFLPDGLVVRAYSDISKFTSGENIFFVLLRWANDIALLVLPIAIFFKKKSFIRITAYFLTIVCITNVCFYSTYMNFYASAEGQGISSLSFLTPETSAFFKDITFRSFVFGAMFLMEASLIFYLLIDKIEELKFKSLKDVLLNIVILIALAISILPIYSLQYIFCGYSDTSVSAFDTFKFGKPFHIFWCLWIVAEIIALYFIFRKKSWEDKYILVLILSLSLFYQYNEMFTCVGEITAHRMPFQLCNIAGALFILTLITKSKKLFPFVAVVNVIGALVAIVSCNTTPYGVTYVMNIHYMLEHTNVLIVPILCLLLRVFEPLKVKDLKYVIVGFSVYFVSVLLIGGVFTGLLNQTGNSFWACNYLYMFDVNETAGMLGFVAPLFDLKITLFNFFDLTLIQLFIYLAFMAICIGFFFLLMWIFKPRNKNSNLKEMESTK